MEDSTGVVAEGRRGAGFADRASEGSQDRLGLARSGHDDRKHLGRHQGGYGQGVSVSWHVFELVEAAVIELLSTTGGVEADYLDQDRIEKVGDRRIVERQVAVFSHPGADDVDRFVEEPL